MICCCQIDLATAENSTTNIYWAASNHSLIEVPIVSSLAKRTHISMQQSSQMIECTHQNQYLGHIKSWRIPCRPATRPSALECQEYRGGQKIGPQSYSKDALSKLQQTGHRGHPQPPTQQNAPLSPWHLQTPVPGATPQFLKKTIEVTQFAKLMPLWVEVEPRNLFSFSSDRFGTW